MSETATAEKAKVVLVGYKLPAPRPGFGSAFAFSTLSPVRDFKTSLGDATSYRLNNGVEIPINGSDLATSHKKESCLIDSKGKPAVEGGEWGVDPSRVYGRLKDNGPIVSKPK
jgi:hypothetical protein